MSDTAPLEPGDRVIDNLARSVEGTVVGVRPSASMGMVVRVHWDGERKARLSGHPAHTLERVIEAGVDPREEARR